MKPEQQIKEMGMTTALMEADMLNLINKNKELLAALEEAQQQVMEEKKWREVEHEVAAGFHRELIEAQQTIARLESELEEMTIDRNIWRSNSLEWEGEEGETQP